MTVYAIRFNIVSSRDQVETAVQNMHDTECISVQAFANAAREWNTQRVSIRFKE